ncbi:MAG: hypothetical protein EU542_08945 [Promethearchaeota archaeon]|nr:MAG: hypothetical protein EU542_08945 [Candidatus Lokiarchaeota archaeon]
MGLQSNIIDNIMNYSEFLDEDEKEYTQYLNTRSTDQKSKIYDTIHTILKILSIFHGNYDKKLNLEKLFNKLSIPVQEREEYLRLILEFQMLFQTTFQTHSLEVKEIDSIRYLFCKNLKNSTKRNHQISQIPEHINISSQDLSLLNDIVYMFTNVKRGKGFDLKEDSSAIMKGIKRLRKSRPYLFFSNGHGFVYPTEFCIKLGQKTNTYMKSNRPIETLLVNDCKIIIE